MGWFRRRQDEADPIRRDDGSDAAPGAAALAPPVAPPRAPEPLARADGGAWRAAPPLPLLVQRELRTNVPATFQDGLTSWQSPARLGPLGHLVVADGPAGVLTDLNTSLPAPVTLAPDPDVDAMPVAQRSTAAPGPGTAESVSVQRFAPPPDPSGRLPALFTSAPDQVAADPPTAPDPAPRPSVVLAPPRAVQPLVEPDVVALPVLASQPPEPAPPVVQTLTASAASSGAEARQQASSEADERAGAADTADGQLDTSEGEPITAPTLAVEHLDPITEATADTVDDARTTADAGGLQPASFPFASPGPGAAPDVSAASGEATVVPVAPFVQRRSAGADPDGGAPAAPADLPTPVGLGLPIARLADDAAAGATDVADPAVGDPQGSEAPGFDPISVEQPRETAPLLGDVPLLEQGGHDGVEPTAETTANDQVETGAVGPTVRSMPLATGSRGGAEPPAGLGLPLVARLADAAAGPGLSTGPGRSTGAVPAAPPVQRTTPATGAAGSAGPPAEPAGPVATPAASAPAGPLVVRYAAPEPVTISRWADGPTPVEASGSSDPTGPTAETDPGPAAATEIAPLLGDRPSLSVLSVPDDEPALAAARPAPASVDPPPVPVSFVPVPSMPAVLAASDVHRPASSPRATAPIQRLAVPPASTAAPAAAAAAASGPSAMPPFSGTSMTRPPTTSFAASSASPAIVGVQRASADLSFTTRGSGSAGPGSPAASGPSAGDIAVSSGLGSWAADGSVVFAPPGESAFGDASAPVVPIQRSFDGGAGGDDGAGFGPTAAPSLQLVAGGAGGGAPGAGGSSDAELDELARRLYGRIRVQLRRELTLDRERSGSLIEVPR